MKKGSEFTVVIHKNNFLSTDIKKACPNIIKEMTAKKLIKNSANQITEC